MSADFILAQDRRLGRYLLKRALGEGGYGQVFLAWQDNATDDPLPCVVKFPLGSLARDEPTHRRFLHEARLAMRLGSHPNIVHVIDVGVHQGMPFIAMEYVDGVDLDVLMGLMRRRGRGLSLPAVLDVLASAAAGLHHAHFGATIEGKPVGIVHRDVKPANLMISRDGVTKLTDFGIGVILDEPNTGNHMRGTPRYMSPEHVRREVGPAMDVYGLGVIGWELVENRVYRDAYEGAQHYQPTIDGCIPPMLNREVPEQLVAIIKACLDPNPRRRPTAVELLKALSQCPGYSRDPELVKAELASLIGSRRSSGVSKQQLAETPELVATFAILAHPLAQASPAAPAWVGTAAPVDSTLEVEVDAPRVQRRARPRVREATHVLSAAADPVGVEPTKTPYVAPPWFDREHPASAPEVRASTTLQAPGSWPAAPTGATRPRPYFVQTFVSIGLSIVAAAMTAYWFGSERGDARVMAQAVDEPAAPRVVEPRVVARAAELEPSRGVVSQLWISEQHPVPEAAAMAAAAVEPAPPEVVREPPPAAVPAAAPVEVAPAPPPVVEPVVRPKAVSRPKPRVPVTLNLSLLDAAEVQIGREVLQVTKKTEIRVPAGTHRVRWRLPGENDWRDAGRTRFEEGHGYLVRLQASGAKIIDIDGGSP